MSLHGVQAGVTLAKVRNQRKDEASLRAEKRQQKKIVNTTIEEIHMLDFQTYLNTFVESIWHSECLTEVCYIIIITV